MTPPSEHPHQALERIFHEPNRLAIMSALCRSSEGLSFTELKTECELTDGNLSRHLKALESFKAIRIKKTFVQSKPLTTVTLTDAGRTSFVEYLKALEEVLAKAAKSLAPGKKITPGWFGQPSTTP